MEHETLYRFLVNLSESAASFDEYQADKEKAMTAAGLSKEQQELLSKGSEKEIRQYLGDEYATAAQIRIS